MKGMLIRLAVVAAAISFADRSEVTPMEKVLTLLEDLEKQVEEEGTAEAEAYEKLACFCKDGETGKADDIGENEETIQTLAGDILKLESDSASLSASILELTEKIGENEAALKEMESIREKERALFEAEFADSNKAVEALKGAIAHLEEAQSSALISNKAEVQSTLDLADAMAIQVPNKDAVTAFLAIDQPGEAPGEYEFKSGGIIDTLKELQTKFEERRDEIQKTEDDAQAAFEKAADAKREEIDADKDSLATDEEALETTKSEIAEKSEARSEEEAQLNDNKLYLKDLTGQCETKAKEWDQRSKARAGELAAIAKALEILTGTVADKAASSGAGGRSTPEAVGEAAPPAKLLYRARAAGTTAAANASATPTSPPRTERRAAAARDRVQRVVSTAPSHATAPAAAAPAANSSAAPAAKTLASADGGGLFDPPKAKDAPAAAVAAAAKAEAAQVRSLEARVKELEARLAAQAAKAPAPTAKPAAPTAKAAAPKAEAKAAAPTATAKAAAPRAKAALLQGARAGPRPGPGLGKSADFLTKYAEDRLAAARAAEAHDVVFFQVSAVKTKAARQAALRDKVVSQLSLAAKYSKSSTLSDLVEEVEKDPFAKVKVLIRQLIERLLAEANAEATQKGFCDTEMGKAEKARGFRHEETVKLNAGIMELEATTTKLKETIDTLTQELGDLYHEMSEATEQRDQDKANNEKTLEDAKEGLVALKEAIQVLRDYYKGGLKSKNRYEGGGYEGAPGLLQASPVSADMAAEGVVGGEVGAYAGNQEAGEGIIGMLEVIQSDFERTLSTTEAEEYQASRDFADFSKTTKASIATKETGLKQAKESLERTSGGLVAALNDLTSSQELLDKALEALEKLRPTCVDTGMTYEERVARREAEIEALKDALCVLDEEDKEIPECGSFLQTK